MIVVTPSFHFDGRHFNKFKKTAAANCSLFYKCVYALCVVLLCILHYKFSFVLPLQYALCCSCHERCALCYSRFLAIVDSALCCSCNSELDKLGLRRYNVASRARTLWADEHLREPEWANADTAGIVIKSRATSDTIWRQPGAIVWTKLIPAGNLASSHWPTSDTYPPQLCGGSQAPGGWAAPPVAADSTH